MLAIKVRRFDTKAEADAEGDKAVERGERAHIVPPLDAWTGGDRAPWRLMHRMLSILTLICPKCGHAWVSGGS